ncbi:transmembrane protein 272 isoform X2 [Patella vulgata]|uniref:transmembrane protein 272 isoform X2 n=1 Tax=Patella vulgata TaxID=6465 RepID=UPI00217F5973|nr:transmembrane protein 272 isoform X2 [Patella vulgata]
MIRTSTMMRRSRRRLSVTAIPAPSRRGSAPMVLQRATTTASDTTTKNNNRLNIEQSVLNRRQSLTPEPIPIKSASFSLDIPVIKVTRPDQCHRFSNTSPLEKQFYDSTVIWPGVEECEQHYSLMNSVCEAGVESSGICEFLYRAFTIISTTWPVTVLLIVLLALPLVMTAIGVNYLRDCPKEPKLPIYQVVGGVFGIIKVLFLLWKQVKKHKDDVGEIHDEDDLSTMIRMTNVALNIFLTIWFAFGHYWLFSIWKPQFQAPLHEPRNWCDQTVFLFTFWQIVICHAMIACLLVLVIILFYCYCCVKCVLDENKS